jgi:LmbE family N-acetylglucosaminyl deacetylase
VIEFGQSAAQVYVPDGIDEQQALQRCTHMGVGAHQDDLEIMAFHGVLECIDSSDNWFCGVTCTSGVGGPRKEGFEDLAPGEVGALRNEEQNKAADLGCYGAMVQLNHSSSDVKGGDKSNVIADLYEVLCRVQPAVVYTHNPADKHDTHVGVMIATLQAIRKMRPEKRPERLYGCEVWRDLDWLNDKEKICLDVSGHDELAADLINCHGSQVTTAKRYDLATIGRRRANATYSDSHSNTPEEFVTYAMDLSPLIQDDTMSLQDFVAAKLQLFEESVMKTLTNQLRG